MYATHSTLTQSELYLPRVLQQNEFTLLRSLSYYTDHLICVYFIVLYILTILFQILMVINEHKVR